MGQDARWAEIARFYTDEPCAAGALLRHCEGLDTWAGAWLLAGLLAADVPALAADVLRHCPAIACLAARETLLDAADALLRGDRPAEASVVLDVLAALPPPGASRYPGAAPPPLAAPSDDVSALAPGVDGLAALADGAAVAPATLGSADHEPSATTRLLADQASPTAAYHARLRRIQAECMQAQGLFGAARARGGRPGDGRWLRACPAARRARADRG